MGKVGTLKLLAVALVATTALLAIAAVSGAAPGTDASVTTFDQCANGGPPSTSTGCPENWINGILNANNSHYAEDEVTPQRVILELPKNSPVTGRTVEISFLTRKGGVHAYDSLATWNYTQTTADRCANLNAADCVGGSASTLAVPSDPTVVADSNGPGSATSGHQLGGQVFTLYGGTLTGASAYTHDDAGGSSDEYAHITLTYSVPSTADGAKVMLLFGGHIAPSIGPRGWGAGVGAGSISGGPYHVRITAADGASVGTRDNQIMSGAILAPATIVIRKVAVGGDDTFAYTTTGGLSPSSFNIATSGGNGEPVVREHRARLVHRHRVCAAGGLGLHQPRLRRRGHGLDGRPRDPHREHRPRPGRDGDLHVHQLEARQDHHREADDAGRRHRSSFTFTRSYGANAAALGRPVERLRLRSPPARTR